MGEIFEIRDSLIGAEQRLSQANARNDLLLEKNAELLAEYNRSMARDNTDLHASLETEEARSCDYFMKLSAAEAEVEALVRENSELRCKEQASLNGSTETAELVVKLQQELAEERECAETAEAEVDALVHENSELRCRNERV